MHRALCRKEIKAHNHCFLCYVFVVLLCCALFSNNHDPIWYPASVLLISSLGLLECSRYMFNQHTAWSGHLPHRTLIIDSDFATIHPAEIELQRETMWYQQMNLFVDEDLYGGLFSCISMMMTPYFSASCTYKLQSIKTTVGKCAICRCQFDDWSQIGMVNMMSHDWICHSRSLNGNESPAELFIMFTSFFLKKKKRRMFYTKSRTLNCLQHTPSLIKCHQWEKAQRKGGRLLPVTAAQLSFMHPVGMNLICGSCFPLKDKIILLLTRMPKASFLIFQCLQSAVHAYLCHTSMFWHCCVSVHTSVLIAGAEIIKCNHTMN